MFSFESTTKYINWLEFKNILILFSCVMLVTILLYFALCGKSEKSIKITKIIFALTLFILELGRIIWSYFQSLHFNEKIEWLKIINFESCTMMVWLNIILILLSLKLNKNNQFLTYLYNISFGIGLVGGILTFAYPAFVDSYYSILHFSNLQSIITHIILIVLPLYFLKTKQFSPTLKDFWIIPFTYVCIGNISSMAAFIASWNFAFVFYCRPFIALKINIPFPYHILVLFLILSLIMFFVYLFYQIKNNKKYNIRPSKITKFEFCSYVVTFFALLTHILLLECLNNLTSNLIGLYFLIPFVVFVTIEFLLYHKLNNKKAHQN